MRDADILRRVPTQDLIAEESVLGALMLNNEAVLTVLELVKAEDFYRESHRLIYRAMVEMVEGHRPIDAITLTDAIRRMGCERTEGRRRSGGDYGLSRRAADES
jgi:replicative DNA helicase